MSGTAVGMVIGFGLLFVFVYAIFAAFKGVFGGRGGVDSNGPMICPHCGSRGRTATRTKGSTAVELVAWLCLIVPGLIYSLWRLSSRQQVCPVCREPGMIAVTTPRGAQLLRQFAGTAGP
jgi:hypothetical protein